MIKRGFYWTKHTIYRLLASNILLYIVYRRKEKLDMKLVIDIPKDFEQHFNEDKFKDSLLRLKADTNYGLEFESTISGNYEIELLDMLVEAFEKAEIIWGYYACGKKGDE